MKTLLLALNVMLIFLGLPYLQSYSQSCHPGDLCRAVIEKPFDQNQKKLLKDNWNDYSGVDLETTLPISIDRKFNVVSIRLDGIGCIYPSFINDETYRNDFIDESRPQTKYDKLTFYRLFLKTPSLLDGNVQSGEVDELKAICLNKDSGYAAKYYAFRKFWNGKFLQSKIDQLNEIISHQNIKKVYFFIHGFNVPSSLAHIQGNSFFRRILEDKKVKPEEILFVRVFWPSLSEKNSDFLDDDCDIQNRKLKVFKSKLFSYVSNRGYLCGLTLNTIISNLSDKIQYNIISHSFGSVIAACTLFSPKSKINRSRWGSPYKSRLLALYATKPTLKEREMNFFMHAAGMPGKSTFSYLDTENNAKHIFYLGYNPRDKILLKKVWIFRFPARKSSTTLGCNWKGSADKVAEYGVLKGLGGNFKTSCTSTLSEHDIFCYMQQDEFSEFFTRYLNHTSK